MNVNEVSRITGTKYKSLAVVEERLQLLEFSSLALHTSLFSGYVQVLSRGSTVTAHPRPSRLLSIRLRK